jgi:hypothetical protein
MGADSCLCLFFMALKAEMSVTRRYGSARAGSALVCRSTGICEATYSGPITMDAFSILRRSVLEDTDGSPCTVIRMDKCVMPAEAMPRAPAGTYTSMAAPGAVIVRPDQYRVWSEYARNLAVIGVMRAVFLDSNASVAYEWAQRQARLERAKWPL